MKVDRSARELAAPPNGRCGAGAQLRLIHRRRQHDRGEIGMAEPQSNVQPEEARARSNAGGGARAEPRSFDQSKAGAPIAGGLTPPAEAIAQVSEQMAEGGRQLAEQGRRASRQVAGAWRQAVDPLLAMQYDMSQWFDDMFRHTFGFRSPSSAHPLSRLNAAGLFGLPPTDLKETAGAHLLAIELPGLTREDVDLSIAGDSLVVCGHKAEESEDASATYRVSERRYGRFERVFPLPPDVDRGRIAAQFRDGVLKITLPKNPSAAPARSRIEIKS
jgi:HSP20 family protein